MYLQRLLVALARRGCHLVFDEEVALERGADGAVRRMNLHGPVSGAAAAAATRARPRASRAARAGGRSAGTSPGSSARSGACAACTGYTPDFAPSFSGNPTSRALSHFAAAPSEPKAGGTPCRPL